ncbi:MAG: diacylglycerol kinase family protein [Kiritimatiellae bacterium]|jgi:diacylglycerol kinase family enzyme|nr:diacylglycerol kinase family protein [Kiritimatiellia bacterium]
MNETNHVLCILNPAAGNGMGGRRWPKIAALLESFHISYEVLMAVDQPPAETVFQHFQKTDPGHYSAICGIGGDGTHSQVINALMRCRMQYPQRVLPPYALIPLGTGNDIAKSFGLAARGSIFADDLCPAVAAIRHGADYALDVGRIGDIYFVDALTIGLDSHILAAHNRYKAEIIKRPLLRRIVRGNFLYTWCMGLRLWRHKPVMAKVLVDGTEWYHGPVFNLVVNNTRIYGGEFVICPDSFANDGLFETVVFTGHHDYLSRYFLALRNNPREIMKMAAKLGRVSRHAQGRVIKIFLSRPEAAQYDGEMMPARGRFEIEVIPRAIKIKVPAERAC